MAHIMFLTDRWFNSKYTYITDSELEAETLWNTMGDFTKKKKHLPVQAIISNKYFKKFHGNIIKNFILKKNQI